MELSTREDIDAPQDWVWSRITDHQAFEKIALRRGAELQRQDRGTGFVAGAAWTLSFHFRGRDRTVEARLAQVTPPDGWTAHLSSAGIDGTVRVELVEMSRSRTRMIVTTEMTARTLSARLMLQSFKLAKAGMLKRFRERIAAFAADLEERYKASS